MTSLKDLPKNILVPIDFSESSEGAATAASVLAGSTGARVHLLHAYLIPVESAGLARAVSRRYVDQFVAESKAQLVQLASRVCPDTPLGPILVKSGDPREVITAEAKRLKTDLIVMGTHGRRGITRALIGSVAESVVRTAPCSVLVVR